MVLDGRMSVWQKGDEGGGVDQVAQIIGRGPSHELPTLFIQPKVVQGIQQVLNIFLNGWMDDGWVNG